MTRTSGRREVAKGSGYGKLILPFGNGSFQCNLENYDIVWLDYTVEDPVYTFKFVPRQKEEQRLLHMKTEKRSYGKIIFPPVWKGDPNLEYNLEDYDIALIDVEDNGNLAFEFTPKQRKEDAINGTDN